MSLSANDALKLSGATTMVTLLLAFSLCDDSSSSFIASTIFNVVFQ